jgi:hypothetical protein
MLVALRVDINNNEAMYMLSFCVHMKTQDSVGSLVQDLACRVVCFSSNSSFVDSPRL